MEEGRGVFDASAYMLFEASGDSEAYGEWDLEIDAVPAEDDAQSCSYGSVPGGGYCKNETIDATAPDEICNCCCEEEEEEEDEDEYEYGGDCEENDDGVVDQCAAEKAGKSDGWEGSNVKAINDREGDRLFWEMCLAS